MTPKWTFSCDVSWENLEIVDNSWKYEARCNRLVCSVSSKFKQDDTTKSIYTTSLPVTSFAFIMNFHQVKRSPIWEHFVHQDGKAKCKMCSNSYVYHGGTVRSVSYVLIFTHIMVEQHTSVRTWDDVIRKLFCVRCVMPAAHLPIRRPDAVGSAKVNGFSTRHWLSRTHREALRRSSAVRELQRPQCNFQREL